jgi:uncharacterized protein with NRDE domain
MNNSKSLGFGNSSIDSPLLKVKEGTKLFDDIINDKFVLSDKKRLIEKLSNLLKQKKRYLPDSGLADWPYDDADGYSSICMRNKDLGSRTRTIILIDKNNKLDYYEETMATEAPDGEWIHTHIERQL